MMVSVKEALLEGSVSFSLVLVVEEAMKVMV
jgi:hypothetical protein